MQNYTQPRVSVVIPARNEEAFIGDCLDSLHALDYDRDRVEVIVVDNGSQDRTREIAAAKQAIVLLDETCSIAGLRNRGASRAGGEILAFLDADMLVEPQWLRAATRALVDPDVGAVGGLLKIPPNATWVEQTWFLKRLARPNIAPAAWIGSGNFLLRREVFARIGGWDERLVTCEDLDICERIRASGFSLLYVRAVTVIHRRESKTLRQLFRKEMWRGRDNWRRRGVSWRDLRQLPSLVFPAVHGLFCVAALVAVGLVVGGVRSPWLAVCAGLPLVFPVLRSVMIVASSGRAMRLPALLAVWLTYYTARALALVARV